MADSFSWSRLNMPELIVEAPIAGVDVEHLLSHDLPTAGYFAQRLLELDEIEHNGERPRRYFYTCNYDVASLSMCLAEIMIANMDCRPFTFVALDGCFKGVPLADGTTGFIFWTWQTTLLRPIDIFEFSRSAAFHPESPEVAGPAGEKFIASLRKRYEHLLLHYDVYLCRDAVPTIYSSPFPVADATEEAEQSASPAVLEPPGPSTTPTLEAAEAGKGLWSMDELAKALEDETGVKAPESAKSQRDAVKDEKGEDGEGAKRKKPAVLCKL